MPDPLTHHEIEDVLSSIRRLVSEEEAPQGQAGDRKPEKFILTPALRVMDYEPSEQPAVASQQLKPQDPPPLIFRHAPEEGLPSVGESAPPPAAPEKAQTAQGSALEEPPAQIDPARQQKDAPIFSRSAAQAPASEAPNPRRQSLEERIAELEAAVSQSHEEFEPDGSEPEAGQILDTHIFEVIEGHVGFRPELPPTPEADTPPETPQDSPHEARNERQADSPLASLEAALNQDRPARAPAEGPSAVGTAPFPPWSAPADARDPLQLVSGVSPVEPVAPSEPKDSPEKASEGAATQAPQQPQPASTPANGPTPEVLDDDNDDIFVDEDMLRQIVADIVREELQGKLGERITRNVRRMVRREIERALELKKFE